MTALLKAELIKLRTTRTFLALAAVAIGLALLITVLTAILEEPTKDDVLYDVFASDTSGFFVMILAIIGITGEWRHRTITSSLLAAPDRLKFLGAKTLAFAATGVLLSLAIAVAITIVGLIILTIRDLPTPDTGELIGQIARNAGLAALLGAFGVAVGALVRNQVVAVVGILVVNFIVEPVLLGTVPSVGRFGPTVALPTAASGIPPEQAGLGSDVDLFGAGVATLLLVAWIALLFAVSATLLKRRDLD